MSYIKSLNTIKKSINIDLEKISDRDAVKIEKLLKAQKQLNPDFNSFNIDFFIDSLKNHKTGLSFLNKNPNLLAVLTFDTFFKQKIIINFDKDNKKNLILFFKECLENDLINCCNFSFAKEKFGYINGILNYKEFLPESILHLIESKTEVKLDYYISIANNIITKPNILKPSFLTLIKLLNAKKTNTKLSKLNNLISLYSSKILKMSSLKLFFYTFSNFFHWIGVIPKSIEEKIEKQETFKDAKSMFFLLGSIFIILFSGILYGINKNLKEKKVIKKQDNIRFKKSIYGFLTNTDTLKSNTSFFLKEKKSGLIFKNEFSNYNTTYENIINTKVINNSSYDLIFLPDLDLIEVMDINKNSYYIRSNDSLSVDLLINRLYIGKKLAVIKNSNNFKKTPRFTHLIPFSKNLIKKRIQFFNNRTRIELNEFDSSLILKADRNFIIGNQKTNSYTLKK